MTRDPEHRGRNRRSILEILLAGVLVLMIAGIMVMANNWKRNLRVHEIAVDGNAMLSTEKLIKSSGIPLGQLLDEIDLYHVRSRLLTIPHVKQVAVKRELPDRIAIEVVERTPVAVLFSDQSHFLDEEGFVLPATSTEDVLDLPVISGAILSKNLNDGGRIRSPVLQEALKVAMAIQRVDELNSRISELHIARTDDFVLFTAEGGVPVLLGKKVTHEKLVSFIAFWKQVVIRRDIRRLELVDIRFGDQIVARWRGV